MAKFDIITIEDKIQQLLEDGFDQASFIYEFLSFMIFQNSYHPNP